MLRNVSLSLAKVGHSEPAAKCFAHFAIVLRSNVFQLLLQMADLILMKWMELTLGICLNLELTLKCQSLFLFWLLTEQYIDRVTQPIPYQKTDVLYILHAVFIQKRRFWLIVYKWAFIKRNPLIGHMTRLLVWINSCMASSMYDLTSITHICTLLSTDTLRQTLQSHSNKNHSGLGPTWVKYLQTFKGISSFLGTKLYSGDGGRSKY